MPFVLVVTWLLAAASAAPGTHVLGGEVREVITEEPIAGADVFADPRKAPLRTDAHGRPVLFSARNG